MGRNAVQPGFTAGNIVFMYRLLRDSIGTGKQTFLTHIESVLESERLSASDLGFQSTQELLEAMGDCVKLTVFKGGRIYATLIAQPEWDEALAALEKGAGKPAPSKGNKPWKKKKGDKALKPVCPKRVKREDDAVEQESAPKAADTKQTVPTTDDAADDAAPEQAVRLNNDNFSLSDESESVIESEQEHEDDAQTIEEPGTIEAEEAPGIELTVTYNPYTGDDSETKLVATKREEQAEPAAAIAPKDEKSPVSETAPAEPEPQAREAEPVVRGDAKSKQSEADAPTAAETHAEPKQPAHATSTPVEPAAPKAQLPDDLPRDFTTDVFCPGALLHKLALTYPYGADVLGLVTEYFHLACEAQTIQAGRRRATFPIRYTQDGERHTLQVRITRKADSDATGPAWSVDSIEAVDEATEH